MFKEREREKKGKKQRIGKIRGCNGGATSMT